MRIALATVLAVTLLRIGDAYGANVDAALAVLDEVVVTGRQPGRALWRVKSGENELWILGEVSPLPAKLKWRSPQVAKVLARAQEVLVVEGIRDGLWKPSVGRPKKTSSRPPDPQTHQDGALLKDILPPDTYLLFEAARLGFAKGDKEIHRLSPSGASSRLLNGAARVLKLAPASYPTSVAVSRLAQKAKVKVTHVPQESGGPQQAPGSGPERMAACSPLEALLEQIDDGGTGWKALANAWSVGDIESLRKLVPAHAIITGRNHCAVASSGGRESHDQAAARNAALWQTALIDALHSNETTLAVIPIAQLFAEDGVVASLAALGYEVLEP